ncbi:anti-sigma factor domain-containing protein [Ahrensia sp. R2A130]|uniref:anti-sigma factor n=1 Tax=Ahrensia sp. R2A130 TaxID=744979 RepID=UPI0001E09C59|nr:anti-sigma factor [Ahrensia sp. R2A130]EFL88580.1 conserved hypothetical protein [Ahrensia sp. R2A130]
MDDDTMTKDERSATAAEYVMGTLPVGERKAVRLALETDEALLDEVHTWERHFGALNASIAPEIPPPSLWDRIERSLPEAETAVGSTPVVTAAPAAANDNALRRSRNRWRLGTMAAALAAALFGAIVVQDAPGGISGVGQKVAGLFQSGDPYAPAALDGRQFVAVVNADGGASPSLVVSVDGATGEVKVRSLGVTRPDGKSLEVWYVPDGEKAVSVGLLGEGEIDLKTLEAKNGDLFAISLEPSGGSPTGTATGPVIYSGKLVEEPTE